MKLKNVVLNYSFYYFNTNFDKNEDIYQKIIKDSIIIIIGSHIDTKTNNLYFIVGFKQTIIVIKDFMLHKFHPYLLNNDLNIYFFAKYKRKI